MRTLPESPNFLDIDGRAIPIDGHGYLTNPDDWDEHVAEAMAARLGLTLTDEHWQAIRFMRAYLEEHGLMADARFVFNYLGTLPGSSGKPGRVRFFELFPYGHVGQLCRISGMRQPRAWSTG